MMVSNEAYEIEGDDFLGFVGTMKAHVTKENKTIMKYM